MMKRFVLAGLLAIFFAAPVQAAEVTQITYGLGGSLTFFAPPLGSGSPPGTPEPIDPGATLTLGFASTGGVISPGAAVSLVSFNAGVGTNGTGLGRLFFDLGQIGAIGANLTGSFNVNVLAPAAIGALGAATVGGLLPVAPGGVGAVNLFGFLHCNNGIVAQPCGQGLFANLPNSVQAPINVTIPNTLVPTPFPLFLTAIGGFLNVAPNLNSVGNNALASAAFPLAFTLGGNTIQGAFGLGGQEVSRQTVQTPEPGLGGLMLAGLGLLGGLELFRRRRQS